MSSQPPPTPRISASSYSNTAPLIWSFLYGRNHGKVELVLDNAPARSAELLTQDRVDAALVPVIAAQLIDGVRIVPDVCIGATKRVKSVCLVTTGQGLEDVRTVALDASSKTSVVLTKIIFREFLGFEPVWRDADPNIDAMLAQNDAALLIGDPALKVRDEGGAVRDEFGTNRSDSSPIPHPSSLRVFDIASLWHDHTGLGFIFAMWMTRRESLDLDLATARDEGLDHLDEIAANYAPELNMAKAEMLAYLGTSISYRVDGSMVQGLKLFFELAARHDLIPENRPVEYL